MVLMIIVNYLPNLFHSPLIHSLFFSCYFKSRKMEEIKQNFQKLNEIKNEAKINNKEKDKVNEQLKRLKKNVKKIYFENKRRK